MIRKGAARAAAWLAGFGRDRSGLIALKFALVLPPIAALTLGAIDLHAVQSTKVALQDVADSAALAGANELGLAVDDAGPKSRARQWVETNLPKLDGTQLDVQVDVLPQPDGARALKVTLAGTRPSFFGNLLPPGGWKLHAEAIAATVGMTPLCVIASESTKTKVINVKGTGKINAPGCMVHSNADILVEGGAITAAAVQASDKAVGNITPAPSEGAAKLDDPFATMALSQLKLCVDFLLPTKLSKGSHVLAPGVHCGGYEVYGNAELTLLAGEHWFLGGHLIIKEDAQLKGENTVLFFDKDSKFEFKDRSTVNLDGRKTGRYAGFVMIALRENTQDFIISSDNVESLLGVLYVPNAKLIVKGSADVARESAWTVLVSKWLELDGAPSLFINANYDATEVPVPNGVGPRQGGSRLVK